MSLARVKTWVADEGLMAPDLNTEFDNIRLNPQSLISPLTANLAAGGFRVTNLAAATTAGDAVRFDDVPAVATQANQETATSLTTVVTPGRLQFHPSACKAWATGDFAGATSSSYNLTSVTDSGTGYQSYIWDVDFSTSNYVPIASVDNNGSARSVSCRPVNGQGAEVKVYTTADALVDANKTQICAFGDQA